MSIQDEIIHDEKQELMIHQLWLAEQAGNKQKMAELLLELHERFGWCGKPRPSRYISESEYNDTIGYDDNVDDFYDNNSSLSRYV